MDTNETHDDSEHSEQRSTSGVIIGSLFGTGAAAAGLGRLADGLANLHDSFSGGKEQAQTSAPPRAPEQTTPPPEAGE